MTLAACLALIPVVLAILAFPFFMALPDGCPDNRDPDDLPARRTEGDVR